MGGVYHWCIHGDRSPNNSIGTVFVLQCRKLQGSSCKPIVLHIWVYMVNNTELLYFLFACWAVFLFWALPTSTFTEAMKFLVGRRQENQFSRVVRLLCVSAGGGERGAGQESEAEVHVRLRRHCRRETPDSGGTVTDRLSRMMPHMKMDGWIDR